MSNNITGVWFSVGGVVSFVGVVSYVVHGYRSTQRKVVGEGTS